MDRRSDASSVHDPFDQSVFDQLVEESTCIAPQRLLRSTKQGCKFAYDLVQGGARDGALPDRPRSSVESIREAARQLNQQHLISHDLTLAVWMGPKRDTPGFFCFHFVPARVRNLSQLA